MTDLSPLRKRSLEADAATSVRDNDEIDIAGCATIAYSSENPAHPVEHLLDSAPAPEPRVGSVRALIPSSTSSWNLTSRRRSAGSCMKSRRRYGSVPRKYA